jgi:predicted NACHT family NTPase
MKSIKVNFKSQLQNWNDFFLQKNLFNSVKNIIKFIQKHPQQKIIIVCGYELIKTINYNNNVKYNFEITSLNDSTLNFLLHKHFIANAKILC